MYQVSQAPHNLSPALRAKARPVCTRSTVILYAVLLCAVGPVHAQDEAVTDEVAACAEANDAQSAKASDGKAALAAADTASSVLTLSVMLGYRQTFTDAGVLESLTLQLEGDHHHGSWGAYGLARLRVSDFDHLIDGANLWLHQGYVYTTQPWGEIKVGKVLSAFGRIWDYGFYGPLITNNDVKMIPDFGASVVLAHAASHAVQIVYTGQYAPVDGRALTFFNRRHALRLYSRRHHIFTARVAPAWQAAAHTRVELGLSGQRFSAAHNNGAQVLRAAGDAEIMHKDVRAFVEVGGQYGSDRVVQDDLLIGSHHYVWTGVQWSSGPWKVRYHFNYVGYHDGTRTIEILHQPGIGLQAGPHWALNMEGVFWQTSHPLLGRGDRALNILAGGTF